MGASFSTLRASYAIETPEVAIAQNVYGECDIDEGFIQGTTSQRWNEAVAYMASMHPQPDVTQYEEKNGV